MKKFKKTGNISSGTIKEKKKFITGKMVIGLMFVFILISSAIGYFSSSLFGTELISSYNGHVFKLDTNTNRWSTELNGKKVYFNNLPSDIPKYNFSGDAVNFFKTSMAIFGTYDPDAEFKEIYASVEFDLDDNFLKNKNAYFVYSFTKENAFNKPVITCANATQEAPVLYFTKSDITQEPSLDMKDNCIIFSAPDRYGTIALRDELLFRVLGIK